MFLLFLYLVFWNHKSNPNAFELLRTIHLDGYVRVRCRLHTWLRCTTGMFCLNPFGQETSWVRCNWFGWAG